MNYDYFCHMTHNTDNVAAEGHKHVCLNCGTEYEGRFCPECGQRSTVGRLTIGSIFEHFLVLAGFSNGKLLKTVSHYVIRPGHMMREYLQGKRATYIRPLNILVVLSLFFLLAQMVIPVKLFGNMDDQAKEVVEEGRSQIIVNGRDYAKLIYNVVDSLDDWLKGNMGYYRLFWQLLLIPGTMLCFRKSELCPRTNLAENFFIQVFVSNQLLTLELLWLICTWGRDSLPVWLFAVLLVYDYKQLFGFSWLSTTWKVVKVYVISFFLLIVLFCLIMGIGYLLKDYIQVPLAS